MAVVHKAVLVNYSAQQMFELVDHVEDYPQFLPWCGGVEVKERQKNKLRAKLNINYHGLRQSFTTENTNVPSSNMTMRLVEGPFRHFEARWSFMPLRDDACKIEFDMQYEFSSRILEAVIGPVFNRIANSFVDSFCRRAEQIYG